MELLQISEPVEVFNPATEFDLQKQGDNNRVRSRLQRSIASETRPFDLFVEIGREQEEPLVLEMKSIAAFGYSSLAKDQASFASHDRIANDGPLLERMPGYVDHSG